MDLLLERAGPRSPQGSRAGRITRRDGGRETEKVACGSKTLRPGSGTRPQQAAVGRFPRRAVLNLLEGVHFPLTCIDTDGDINRYTHREKHTHTSTLTHTHTQRWRHMKLVTHRWRPTHTRTLKHKWRHTITDIHMDIQTHRTEAFKEKKLMGRRGGREKGRKGRWWWRRKRERSRGRKEGRAQRGHTGQPTQTSEGRWGVDTTLPSLCLLFQKDFRSLPLGSS